MALKPFNELVKLDIAKHTQQKPTFKKENGKSVKLPKKYWLDYIEWSVCLMLLYENGAESVRFGSELNENGYPAFFDSKGGNPFIRVRLDIDGNEYRLNYPVIEGSRTVSNPNQLVIHRAEQRAFVKCVAINTGLGLSLWMKDEVQTQPDDKEIQAQQLKGRNKKANEELIAGFSALVKKFGDTQSAHEKLDSNKGILNSMVANDGMLQAKLDMVERIKQLLND